ncbi:MAG TPA: hypothetical protein VK348_15755, partial [Planctomycetota bacterium]|nr:hypothetical protein [Planctomycetota bacterium]
DDKALVQRLVDLQTGRTASRAKKHKLFAVGAGAAALVLLLLFATLCELAAARQLATALRGQVADGDGVRTQTALRVVAEDHPWLPSGLAAAATAQQQAITLLHRADHLLLTGDCDAAETLLRVALPELRGRDHAHAEHLLARVGGERPLHAWLARVEARGRDDGEAAEALARATKKDQLEFLVAQLPRVTSDAARLSLLRALQHGDPTRGAGAVAQAYLAASDPTVLRLCEGLLTASVPHLLPAEQMAIVHQLDTAAQQPERRERAQRAAALLQAATAAPR